MTGTIYVFIISSKNSRKTKVEYTRKKCFVIFYTVIQEKKIISHCILPINIVGFSCHKNEPGNNLTCRNVHPYCSRTNLLLLFSLNNKIVNKFSTTYCLNSENKVSTNQEPNTYLEGGNFPSSFPIKETNFFSLMALYFIQNVAHTG